ncbi:MAG TPA: M14 family zinc carboxypeptidase [Vicinamibacterales bacterium]|nr:M14 family zinc carboxypeptidase [Vicinamibacterales bacterium]
MRLSSVRARAGQAALITGLFALAGYRASAHDPVYAQAARASGAPQKLDEEYTARIKKATPDPRIITEYVDHMPASATVPSPLKFLGYVPGEPGHLTYHADIVRYYEALEKASTRVKLFRIGKSEEGRDMVALAIADEATIKQLDKYTGITAKLTDPRQITDAQAKQLIAAGKPIYYATGSIHTPETGSPEMLTELAFRLAVEETPFIQTIRNNAIVVLTPATEVDGREKVVDNFNFSLKHPNEPQPGLMYWGQYVQHDNNRDGIGVGLKLTQNILKSFLTWHPTVFHDLHESVTLLYASTGTGPYNTIVDPIQINEWWLLAQNEMMEMAKRNVPGVWTYNYYDGWVPNYMFWIGVTHNSIGRFYETQSFRGQNYAMGALNQSREWYRPVPTPNDITWGPRANVNMQESAILITMNNVARNHEMFLENYYLKNKHAIERGQTKAPYAYVVPAAQRRRVEAAELMNLLRREGAEVHTANAAFTIGNVAVAQGDYIVRLDQPYGAVVETLLGVQYYAPENPRPYDDTGWSIPLLRNLKAAAIADKSILQQPMTLASADFSVPGAIAGTGPVLIVDHTTDNTLMTFRFKHAGVKMAAAEQAFDLDGHHFAPGAFVIANADRAALEPSIKELGLSAWATASAPTVPTHDLDVPRIGYIHTWTSTQDEGWVRMAFDKLKVPYTYFGDNLVRQGNLRQKYDVLIYPHAGGSATNLVYGGVTGNAPRPYKKTDETPHLGVQDSTDDMRGGLGYDGLQELYKFVQQGGLLITEGATATIFPEFNLTQGVSVETPESLYVRGSVLKAVLGDRTSPVLYGYDQNALAVYFNQAPVLAVGGGGFGGRGGGRGGGPNIPGIPNMQPNAVQPRLTTLDRAASAAADTAAPAGQGRGGRGGGGRGGRGGAAAAAPAAEGSPSAAGEAPATAGQGPGRGGFGGFGRGGGAPGNQPRVLLSFPADPNDLLLSGLLVGGEALAGRAALVDASVGKGHVLLFAARPFWRFQTQGAFFLAFNAILNWNDLDAGRVGSRPTTTADERQ